jgi:hypothetical protein
LWLNNGEVCGYQALQVIKAAICVDVDVSGGGLRLAEKEELHDWGILG